jgi:hypothetical protein
MKYFALLLSLLVMPLAQANEYESLSAAEKQRVLEQMQIDSEYNELPQWTGFELLPALRFLLPTQKKPGQQFMGVTIDRQSDFMPEGRPKTLHALGAVASIRFVGTDGHPYTGLFKGADYGVARFSLGAKPGEGSFAPGIAVKFLIDGQPSRNFVAMFSLDGQTSYNFFENNFSNHVPPIKGTLLRVAAKVIELVTDFANLTRVDQLATITQDGQPISIANAVAPEQLILVPNQDLSFAQEAHEFREDLLSIPVGTKLYDIYAKEGSGQRFLGYLETTSIVRASEFSDKKLFFKHNRVEDKAK